jgi:hypothetical protein
MSILLPIVLLLLAALALMILRLARPKFKYLWMIAAGGATLALVGISIWHNHLPQSLSTAPWQPVSLFNFSPTWLADGISWPFALSLAALTVAVIWTSVVRLDNDPAAWAGTLLFSALGILAVTAGNPITLILIWSSIDLVELIIMIRSTENVLQNRGVVFAFAIRVAGTGLVLWANLVGNASGNQMNFQTIPASTGIYLLIAAGIRLGSYSLYYPHFKEHFLQRGFGTSLRLVSMAASLCLLARIPADAIQPSLLPYLYILTAATALYSGWKWLRASDELRGSPYWMLGLASLSIFASLRGNPIGSIGWGIALILDGGLLFLYSARQRRIIWLPLIGLWGLSTFPFSPSATAWQAGNQNSWLYIIPFLPAQALLMAGFIRHVLQPGETSFESQDRWTKVIYPVGLFLLAGVSILLGIWGWEGASSKGQLLTALIGILVAACFTIMARTVFFRWLNNSTAYQRPPSIRFEGIIQILANGYHFFRKTAHVITSTLEGEGGLLWSLLLLTLILSVLSTQGHLP